MRFRGLLFAALLAAGAAAAGCTAEVEEKGRAPDLTEGDPGELPEVDIDPAKVEVSVDTQQVPLPDVDVTPTGGDTARDTAR